MKHVATWNSFLLLTLSPFIYIFKDEPVKYLYKWFLNQIRERPFSFFSPQFSPEYNPQLIIAPANIFGHTFRLYFIYEKRSQTRRCFSTNHRLFTWRDTNELKAETNVVVQLKHFSFKRAKQPDSKRFAKRIIAFLVWNEIFRTSSDGRLI